MKIVFHVLSCLMNLQAIALAQETFVEVVTDMDTAVSLFYGRLFVLDPSLRPLFPDDLAAHGCKFMGALHTALNGLSEPETVITVIKQWGEQHGHYGVRDAYYHTFGRALFWMLAQRLQERFTPEVADAWTELYYLLAGLMKEAAVQTQS